MSNINWRKVRVKASVDNIKIVENKLGIILPTDFKVCVLENNGGRPSPYVFDIENRKGNVFATLLDLSLSKETNMVTMREYVLDRLVDNIYPFADDPGGNLICFDYRGGNDRPPKIVYWDHEIAYEDPEGALFYICDTFTQLLDMLYDQEEYKRYVEQCLDKLKGELEKELLEIKSFNFHDGVEVVKFEVYADGITEEFPVVMFSLTKDNNEFFYTGKDGDRFSGSKRLLAGVKEVVPYDDVDWDYLEDELEVDTFKEAGLTLIDWFAVIWEEVMGNDFKVPAYIGRHGYGLIYDLNNKKWVKSGDVFST